MKEWILQKRWRIIVSGIFITAIPLLSLAFIINFQITTALEERIIKEAQWFAKISSHHLEDRLNSEISLGMSYVTRPLLWTAIQRGDRHEMTRHLRLLVAGTSSVERAFITTPQGVQLANYPTATNTIGKDFSTKN